METSILFPLFAASLVLALKPGPHMLAYTTMALDGRLKALLAFWTGSMIAGGVLYLALLTGLSMIPASFGIVFIFLKAAAAILFINLGVMGLSAKMSEDRKAGELRAAELEKQSVFKNAMSGFLLVLSNPYVLVFILTAVPALTGMTSFTPLNVAMIYAVVMAADILMVTAYCAPLFFVRRYLSERILSGISAFASVAMIAIGLILLYGMFTQGDLKEAGLLSYKHIFLAKAA